MSYPFVQLPHSPEQGHIQRDDVPLHPTESDDLKQVTKIQPESPNTKRSGPTILPPAFPVISPLYNFTQSAGPVATEVTNEVNTPSIVSLDEIQPSLTYPLFNNNVDSTALSYMSAIQKGLVSPPTSVQIGNFIQPTQYPSTVGLNPLYTATLPHTLSQPMTGVINSVNPLSMVGTIPSMPTTVSPPVKSVSPPTSTTIMAPTPSPHNREDGQWLDITAYLNLPQAKAAKELNMPTSSLSKRWKESARNRKWPYRAVCRLDKEIMTLMYNIPPGGALPPEIEEKLSRLLKERQEHLKPVVIRL
eukprot:TRINITY_DN6718_c0_g1_i2.p1 TRINITY_DN6718_c0_g1~~TRINITY_DN6718_c0_g1_i2.p1  ORF type:complete len:303 (-),score=68.49 TRINITY_DN6718_c0_g1_i2:38-946(-)